jgi:hypothetical protein
MKVYALRHKATGEFMPAKMFRLSARGWSHWSPGVSGVGQPHDSNPRLFFTRKAADNSRVQWAAGVWERNVGTTNSYFDPEDYDETVINAPPTPRHKDDLEVVVYELTEVPDAR